MALPFVDRSPTPREFQKLRLILSTFQDGTGQYMLTCRLKEQDERGKNKTVKVIKNLPGWRDFERAVAFAFGGEAQESKAIFDVLLSEHNRKEKYGISCKMREDFNSTVKTGRVNLELSNAAGKFWAELNSHGYNQGNYMDSPAEVAKAVLRLYESWQEAVSIEKGGDVDLSKSSYLALSWNRNHHYGIYQLHQFPLALPNPDDIRWASDGRRIVGVIESEMIFEWYGESGAQLKYYPPSKDAVWKSEPFELEPLGDLRYGVLNKAEAYFPKLWEEACKEEDERKE